MLVALSLIGEVGTKLFFGGRHRGGGSGQIGQIAEMACGQRHHHEADAVTAGEVPAVLAVDRIAQARPARAGDHRLGEESEVGRGGQGDVVQWQPDGAAGSGGIAVAQRGQDRQRRIQPAADVPDRHHVIDRTGVPGRTGHHRETGGGIDGVVHARRAVAPAQHLEMDEVGPLGAQGVIRMPLPPGHIGDQHAAVDDELRHQVLALLAAHIDSHRLFALIETSPVNAVTGVGQRPAVIVGGTADGVDADHLGAECGQRHPGQWHRDEAGDLDDADSGQRRRG